MLRDGESTMVVSFEVDAWTGSYANAVQSVREIDRELRAIAKRRCALDLEEAKLLCLANRREIWRSLGKPSLFAYMEDVLGYAPTVARERLRVATALDEMPVLAEALGTGEQSYSALRELTRIVTPNTQRAWVDAARGKNLRQIEELVSVHRRGDLPTDRPNPDLKPKIVRFEISTATFALLRQAQHLLTEETGRYLDDDELVATLCTAVIDGSVGDPGGQADGRAKHQILTTICSGCAKGWQQAGGVNIPIDANAVARAECDAQRIGSDREPSRAKQDVTPMVRRFVKRRDRGQCTVPGCRSSRFGDVHHIVGRADGGSHEAENLTVLCSAHHISLHSGQLVITGLAPNLMFEERPMFGAGRTFENQGVVAALASARSTDSQMSHVGHFGSAAQARSAEAFEVLSPARMSHVAPSEASGSSPPSTVARIRDTEPAQPRGMSSVSPPSMGTDIGAEAVVSLTPRTAQTSRTACAPPEPLTQTTTSVSVSNYEWAVRKTEAAQALAQAGYKKTEACQLVEDAASARPEGTTLEQLVRDALAIARENLRR